MNGTTIISFLICLTLLGACVDAEMVGPEPTDLSKIAVGAERSEVEAATGGSPITVRSEEFGQVATYGINLGVETWREYEKCYTYCGVAPLFWPVFDFQSQRRKIEVVFDSNEIVQFVRFVPGSLELAEWDREKVHLEREAEIGDANAQFGLYLFNAPDIDRWHWLCVSANNGQPLAQIELARHYWSGIYPFEKDRARSQMWYSLAEQAGHKVLLFQVHSREESLTPAQVAEAERLVAEWKPNPADCEASATYTRN